MKRYLPLFALAVCLAAAFPPDAQAFGRRSRGGGGGCSGGSCGQEAATFMPSQQWGWGGGGYYNGMPTVVQSCGPEGCVTAGAAYSVVAGSRPRIVGTWSGVTPTPPASPPDADEARVALSEAIDELRAARKELKAAAEALNATRKELRELRRPAAAIPGY